jgi:hypothetical protein
LALAGGKGRFLSQESKSTEGNGENAGSRLQSFE